jgi:hypothetical protein
VQVNPEAETFSEAFSIDSEEKVREIVQAAQERGEAVVVADSKATLKKLQDDLRRAGYRKVK